MQNFDRVKDAVSEFNTVLTSIKASMPNMAWYPYGTLGNFWHLEPLINDELDALFEGGRRLADIGAADGELAFFLESLGNHCEIFDYGPTNYNSLQGAKAIKAALRSHVQITEVDLDSYFPISSEFDMIFFLGILYHLKNPFYVLENLSRKTRYMFLSTRVTRHFRAGGPDVSETASAYLLDAAESNNDSTNYWLFTEAGLRRILDRTGWDIIAYRTVGDVIASNPQDSDHDERAFCAIRSRHFAR